MPNNAEWGDVLVASGFELYGHYRERIGNTVGGGLWTKITNKFK